MRPKEIDIDKFKSDEYEDEFCYEPPMRTRETMLATRRRIEDLQELRRMRQLFQDDDFNFNFD